METQVKKRRNVNPRLGSNILSKITFWYTLPMFIKSFRKKLEEEDLYEVIPEYRSQLLGDKIENEWETNKAKTKHSVFLLAWNLFGKYYLLLGLTKIISIAVNVIRPIVIAKVVSFFVPGQNEMNKNELYFYGASLIGLNIIDSVYRQNYFLVVECLSVKLRSSVSSLIFRKILNLSVTHSRHVNFGKITSMITRDVSAFDLFFYFFNESWTGFISTIIICYNMYQKIGSPLFILVSAYIVFIVFAVLAGIKMASLKLKTSEKTDERIDILRQFLSKIRCTKMYVWENYAEEKISQARKKEMDIMFNFYIVAYLFLGLATLFQYVTHYLVIMTCSWIGQVLNAEILYFITSGFQSLYFNIIVAIPYAAYSGSQVYSALRRLQNLMEQIDLESPKTENYENKSDNPEIKAEEILVNINGEFMLNISFNIGKGLTLLTGPASSGKTVLLLTILREYEITKGSLNTKGEISYASQEPWLFPATIRQNIIFGSEYIQKRYQKVIEACNLEYDFDLLQKGDLTIVAEQGINLSRGQQSRICLARAVYKESDIYLIDDCFSNLDPFVAQSVFENCIVKFLKNKLVVLVSNVLNFSAYADNIIDMRFKETVVNLPRCSQNEPAETRLFREKFTTLDFQHAEDNNINSETKLINKETEKDNIYAEFKKPGLVSTSIYNKYIQFGGGKISFLVVCGAFLLGQIFISYKDILISDWVNIEEKINVYNKSKFNSTIQELVNERNFIRHIYSFVIVAIAAIITFRGYVLSHFSKKISVNLHSRMIQCIINGSMKFFDQSFIGNIVNRFSKDLVVIDECIPYILLNIIAILFEAAGTLIMISLVSVYFLIPTVVFISSLLLFRYGYLKTGTALKRLEATTKIPIVGYVNAALEGLSIIKTFNAKEILKEEFEQHLDLHISSCLSDLFCLKAFVFVVDNLATLFISIVMLKFIIFDESASPGDVGLAISQGFVMSSILFYGFYKWAELETQMTSAERAFDYTNIQQETKTGSVIEGWPKLGEISYENVFLSLNNCKSYVLKNINFVIKPAEKIGIVGRTGAGKSSILSTLFRLYQIEGNIKIDGIDIKTLSLEFLRSKISIIPQDPIILNESIRDNIDPERRHSDEKIWEALETVKLKTMFHNLETQLVETEITFAQKQLICLARVLLAQNKILLLDEVTENGDMCTENLIYDIVDRHFSSKTVIKITHKMKFVMNCDKVLVVDSGEVVEFDSPDVLMSNQNSLFYKMIIKSDYSTDKGDLG